MKDDQDCRRPALEQLDALRETVARALDVADNLGLGIVGIHLKDALEHLNMLTRRRDTPVLK